MVTQPANTGITMIKRNAVISHDQTKIGIFIIVIPGARKFRMVTITLIAPKMEEIPIKCTERIKKSVELGPNVVDNGA